VGDPWRDVNQGAVPGDRPLLYLAVVFFPDEKAVAMKRIEPFGVAGMEMVAPVMAWKDGNEMEGLEEILRSLEPPLPRKEAHPPGVGVNLSAQIDELHSCHQPSLLACQYCQSD
jgi:hypothetical protein